jgi:hypothetical protein
VRCTIGIPFQGDRRDADHRERGEPLLQIMIFGLAFRQSEPDVLYGFVSGAQKAALAYIFGRSKNKPDTWLRHSVAPLIGTVASVTARNTLPCRRSKRSSIRARPARPTLERSRKSTVAWPERVSVA